MVNGIGKVVPKERRSGIEPFMEVVVRVLACIDACKTRRLAVKSNVITVLEEETEVARFKVRIRVLA